MSDVKANIESYIERLRKPAGVPPFIQREAADIMEHQQKRILSLSVEGSRKDDVIAHLDYELGLADSKLKRILDWCEGNISSQSQVAPFCVQVRDLLEATKVGATQPQADETDV